MKAPLSTLQPSRRINMNRRQVKRSQTQNTEKKKGDNIVERIEEEKNVQRWVTHNKKEEAKRERM